MECKRPVRAWGKGFSLILLAEQPEALCLAGDQDGAGIVDAARGKAPRIEPVAVHSKTERRDREEHEHEGKQNTADHLRITQCVYQLADELKRSITVSGGAYLVKLIREKAGHRARR